eukprot:3698060-Prymnesium_polylepis.2
MYGTQGGVTQKCRSSAVYISDPHHIYRGASSARHGPQVIERLVVLRPRRAVLPPSAEDHVTPTLPQGLLCISASDRAPHAPRPATTGHACARRTTWTLPSLHGPRPTRSVARAAISRSQRARGVRGKTSR